MRKHKGIPAAALFAGRSYHDHAYLRTTAAIDDVFMDTRAAVVEPTCPEWSPAQHARRAS